MIPEKRTAIPGLEAAIRGKRGQVLLRDLLAALDEMPEKLLIASDFVWPDGKCCALGALGLSRGMDSEDLNALGGDVAKAARAFAAPPSLIEAIQRENDAGPWVGRRTYQFQHNRWIYMRAWVASKITAACSKSPDPTGGLPGRGMRL